MYNIFATAGTEDSSYQIQRSLRFPSENSAYLDYTPALAGDRKTWTWSGWIKRSALSSQQHIYSIHDGASDAGFMRLQWGSTDDKIDLSGWSTQYLKTTARFRDVSDWFHLCLVFDTTADDGNERCRLFINGVLQTDLDTNATLTKNGDYPINLGSRHRIGAREDDGSLPFDGYMAEIRFIDGEAKSPNDFAFTDDNGQWSPKQYDGSYGTNGYYLDFSDNTNTTTLGLDRSGNGNDFTLTNFTTDDSVTDTPTNNHCIWTDLSTGSGSYQTIANTGLTAQFPNGSYAGQALGTHRVNSGKWYWEYEILSTHSLYPCVGISSATNENTSGYSFADSYLYHADANKTEDTGSRTSYGATFAATDIIGVALDMDNGNVTMYKNGVSQGQLNGSTLPDGDYGPTVTSYNSTAVTLNCGQSGFAHTPPAGYSALSTANLPTPDYPIPQTQAATKLWYSSTGNDLQIGNIVKEASTYTLAGSARFNSDDSNYMHWTPSTAGDRRSWTWFGRVKRSKIDTAQILLAVYNGSTTEERFQFLANNKLDFYYNAGAGNRITTDLAFTDPNRWMNIMLVADTDNATANDRVRLYVDNVRMDVTYGGTPASSDTMINSTYQHYLGRDSVAATSYFDGLICDVHFVNGQSATDMSWFVDTDANGVLIPKAYDGPAMANNSYILRMSDGTSLATLAEDDSGLSNDWTAANFSVTAGDTYDVSNDSPTNNHCTLDTTADPDDTYGQKTNTSEAGMTVLSWHIAYNTWAQGTFELPQSGKYYWEHKVITYSDWHRAGIQKVSEETGHDALAAAADISKSYYSADGNKYSGSTATAFGSSWTTAGDTIGVAVDMDEGKIWFAKNNTWQDSGNPGAGTNPAFNDLQGQRWRPHHHQGSAVGNECKVNFGQHAFEYTPPTGFVALTADNAPDTATVATTPDFLLGKARTTTTSWALHDSTRGVSKVIYPDATSAEATVVESVEAFNRDGFRLGTNNVLNGTGNTYVGLAINKGNVLDIVKYTGTGVARSVAHSGGITPGVIWIKNLTDASNWPVYHQFNTAAPETDYLSLNHDLATVDDSTIWNDTAPNTTHFSVGTNNLTNGSSDEFVAYVFYEIEGLSKYGYYEGNGSTDGPFVWCGFLPEFLIIKKTDGTAAWTVKSSLVDTYNPVTSYQYLDITSAETTGIDIDFLSNGFKVRAAGGFQQVNTSGGDYIFMAFAKRPFKYSRAF